MAATNAWCLRRKYPAPDRLCARMVCVLLSVQQQAISGCWLCDFGTHRHDPKPTLCSKRMALRWQRVTGACVYTKQDERHCSILLCIVGFSRWCCILWASAPACSPLHPSMDCRGLGCRRRPAVHYGCWHVHVHVHVHMHLHACCLAAPSLHWMSGRWFALSCDSQQLACQPVPACHCVGDT